MDKITRGFIESYWDKVLRTASLPSIGWVREEVPISSLRDLALGHDLGMLAAFAVSTLSMFTPRGCSEEDFRAIREMLKRRLPEIVEKIERELGR